MTDATKILTRCAENPILTKEDVPGSFAVFNPSPVMYQGKTLLVLSVFKHNWGNDGKPSGGYIATSDDGVHFDVKTDKPLIEMAKLPSPFNELEGIPMDCRISKIDDTYYLMHPAFKDGEGPFMVLGKTKNFVDYTPMEISTLPSNRGASLFPEKINGKYYRLERPGSGHDNLGSIWISQSPDLIHWGCHRKLLKPGYAPWNNVKMGPTPPIKTPHGWLEIVHGVMSWTPGDHHYYIGAVLLDLNNPEVILGRTYSYLLAAEQPYETTGAIDNVVFPCGAIGDLEKDELRLYYGGADTVVCLATGRLSAVIEACLKGL